MDTRIVSYFLLVYPFPPSIYFYVYLYLLSGLKLIGQKTVVVNNGTLAVCKLLTHAALRLKIQLYCSPSDVVGGWDSIGQKRCDQADCYLSM